MTPAERCQAFWVGNPTDRLSVQPICMSFAARDSGVSFRRYAEDTLVLARCQARVADRYGFDVVSLTSDRVGRRTTLAKQSCGSRTSRPCRTRPALCSPTMGI